MSDIAAIMRISPVIPVLVIDDAAQAHGLATALVAGGLRVLEVTMRTPAAIEAIQEMKRVPGAVVGAGTVVSEAQFRQAHDAGAEFIVSPGLTDRLGRTIVEAGAPFLPGVATASDVMRGLDLGLDHFKFFPAEANGGMPSLTALAAPFRQCRFCPTGGITEATARDWLALPFVLCIGGTWVAHGTPADVRIKAAAAAEMIR